uniref:Fibronectin type-III domain-containing protein n=1 Tax=Ditylenchus dipsaci TaxID=166011 RepID=A0A915DDF0_9BILA
MIEAQNGDREGVFGTYFDCHTPNELEFPAPSIVDVSAVDSSRIKLAWTPLESTTESNIEGVAPTVDGYVVYWKKIIEGEIATNQTHNSQFVRGMSTSHTFVTNLEPQSKYVFWMASHHKQLNRPSTFLSPKVESETLRFVEKPTVSLNAKPPKAQRWYRRPEYHLVLIVLVLLLLLLCLASGCVWGNSWLSENRKRKKKEKMNIAKAFELELLNMLPESTSTSNPSTSNGLINNCSQPLILTTSPRNSIAGKRQRLSKASVATSSNHRQSNASTTSSSQLLLDQPAKHQQYLDAKEVLRVAIHRAANDFVKC